MCEVFFDVIDPKVFVTPLNIRYNKCPHMPGLDDDHAAKIPQLIVVYWRI